MFPNRPGGAREAPAATAQPQGMLAMPAGGVNRNFNRHRSPARSMLVPRPMRSSSHFASTIRRARALLGCSSAELARILEVSESTLARWETGRQKPDLERQHDVVRRLRALTRLQRNQR